MLTLTLNKILQKNVFRRPEVARVTCKETHFWPFFDLLLIPKWGITRDFRATWSLEMAKKSPRTGLECVFEHPNWSKVTFKKTRFRPFLDHFSVRASLGIT